MRRPWIRFAAVTSILLPLLSPLMSRAFQQSDQQIVNNFYPAELVSAATSADPGEPFNRISCFARLDRETIVAGYSNDTLGAILLLKSKDKNDFKKVFQVSGLDLAGTNCSVTPVQLSEKRPPSVLVSFAAASGNSMDWVFDVKDNELVSIGPTTQGRGGFSETQLSNTDAINFYQDGSLQLVSGSEYPPPADGSAPANGMQLYRLKDGTLQLDNSVSVLFETELSGRLGDNPLVFHFFKPAGTSGPFALRVVNGDRHHDHKIGSGTVLINGIAVVSLGGSDSIIKVDVDLQNDNSLEIRATSNAGDKMLVAVEADMNPQANVP